MSSAATSRQLAAARARYEGSWAQELVARLRVIEPINSTTLFAAALLWSVLPFIIILSSLASQRIDDDLSRHIGLNAQGAHIVRSLFRSTPAHSVDPIVIAVLLGLAGTIAAVGCLQVIYERAFKLEARGWHDIPRLVGWSLIVLACLVVEGIARDHVRHAVGPAGHALVAFAGLVIFFWWTMHFLLAGRMPWRALARPAVLTALLWGVLALISSLSFSDTIVSDSKLYGTIGVVFTLLTWFMLIGIVITLGAVGGAVWQERSDRAA